VDDAPRVPDPEGQAGPELVEAGESESQGDVSGEDTTGVEVPARPLVGEPAAPPPPATVTLESFRSIWPGLFGGLRELLGARRWALFRETEPGGVEGSTLIIHVRHDFHLASLKSDPAVAAVVATKAGDLLGGSVSVQFRAADATDSGPATVGDGDAHEDAADEEGGVPDKDTMEEASADSTDPFKLVEDELGGVVIDDFTDGPS
jgi:hypothetical protein